MKKILDLGKDKEVTLFMNFAIPAILGMIAINTAGIVDSYFIGNCIGADAIGAITLVTPLMSIILGIVYMIVSGGVVLAGTEYGKNNLSKSNNYFNITLSLIIIAAITIMIILRFSMKYIIVNMMNIEPHIAKYVFDYFYTVLYFMIAYMLVSFFSFFLKLDGMPKLVVIVTLIGVIINIILDYLFVGVIGMGMRGAALATGTSQLIPCIIFIIVTIVKSQWKFGIPKYNKKEIWMILFNGSSELLGLSAIGIAGYIYNIIITKHLGMDGVSAYGVAMQIANVAILLFYGISDGIQSIVSYNFGAKLYKRVDKFRNIAFLSSFVIGIVICIALIGFGDKIAYIFVKNQRIVNMSSYIMVYYGISLLIAGINLNATTYYTALGQPVKSAVIAVTRSLVGLVIGLIILPYIFGEIGLWIPLIFTEILTFILVLYYVKKYPYGNKIVD